MTNQSDCPDPSGTPEESAEKAGDSAAPPTSDLDPSAEAASKSGDELSAEEQMALYEESLKDTDWGHQPC